MLININWLYLIVPIVGSIGFLAGSFFCGVKSCDESTQDKYGNEM